MISVPGMRESAASVWLLLPVVAVLTAGCGTGDERLASRGPGADGGGLADDGGGLTGDGGALADGGSPADGGPVLADPFDVRTRPSHVGPDGARAQLLPSTVTRTIHVAADGDDNRTLAQATNAATPWRTVAKVNASAAQLLPGDAVLFRRGDVFRETLLVPVSGGQAAPLVFAGYGDAPQMPVLSGADVITGWQVHSGAIYKAQVSQAVSRVFVDGQEMHLARSPNTGFFRNSAASATSVTAAGLAGVAWVGGAVWAYTQPWLRESATVVSQAGNTVTFSATQYPVPANAGFIVEGPLAALDAPGEWAWSGGTLYLQLPAGASWATAKIEATVRQSSIRIGEHNKVSDLEFRGLELAMSSGAAFHQPAFIATRIHVTDCMFRASDDAGILTSMTTACVVENNWFDRARGAGAKLSGSTGMVFRRNVVEQQNMDPQRGMGAGTGCDPGGCVSSSFEENYIRGSGYHGIGVTNDAGGSVRRNVVLDSMQYLADGAAIYAYGAGSTGLVFTDNIVVGAPGNGDGNADGYSGGSGIYIDNLVPGAVVTGNLVLGATSAILFNSGTVGGICERNGVVDNQRGLQLNAKVASARHNLIYATVAGESLVHVDVLGSANVATMGPLDDNVYRNPFTDEVGRYGGNPYSLAAWRSTYGQDAASRIDTTPWPNGSGFANVVRVVANTELTARPINLAAGLGAGTWIDVSTGLPLPAQVTLPAFAWIVAERR